MKLQFPIKWLLAAGGLCGVGFAALRSASDWWASGVFTATLLGLALSGAYATQRRGTRRAFWAAFAGFGCGYLLLAFGPWCEATIRPRLLTTRLLDAIYTALKPGPAPTVAVWDAGVGERVVSFSPDGRILPIEDSDATARIWGPFASRQDRFLDIGHSLAALLLAVIGGLAARSFYVNRDERRREAEEAAGVT